MNKRIIYLILTVIILGSCTENNKLHIYGDIGKAIDTLIVVSEDELHNLDTIVTSNGKINHAIQVDTPTIYYLVSPECFRGQKGIYMQFFAMPGEKLKLTTDESGHIAFGGSKIYQDYQVVNEMLKEARKGQNEFVNTILRRIEKGVAQDSIMKLYEDLEPYKKRTDEAIMAFIKSHADMEAAATLILQVDPNRMDEALSLLSDKVKNGRMKPFFQALTTRLESQEQAEKEANAKHMKGIKAPDFTLNDLMGNPFTLSSTRGKYVVLDFWGSWCCWCIKGMPDMKRYYEKYAGRFEIIGIDCNDSEKNWKEAVKKNQLPWPHVFTPKGSTLLNDYGVESFPTKVIIDPNGIIVKTVVGEKEEFYTYLDQLLGQ